MLFVSYFVMDGSILLYWFPFFGLGLIIFRYKCLRLDFYTFCFLSLITFIFIFVKYGTPHLLISILSIAFIYINLYYNINLQSNLIVKLGKISYSIYLVHLTIIQIFFYFFKSKGIGNSAYLTIGSCILAVLFFSFFYLIFEQYSKKLSQKIQYI
jgi:peptidoglycan/LPS O-acetylase OafA/YrhL